ncbi:MAG TPA: D-alanyl-D-alanine carboxypeptidase/D-alanyl-D-alanine-endopeptidase [Ignavibacteria bacterium]|jgi:D-alanyl-D-alanine carboxypeptidase/D-alanyl-D-alanine-endopeptidase (penicillin-binding protein 4)
MKQLKLFLILVLFTSFAFGQSFNEANVTALQQSLDALVQPVNSAGIRISCKVVHADYNKTLYEFHPEEEMIPASITKLIICACAYSKLGKSYNIPTIVYTDDGDINDGTIDGNLYLKGYGDPDLNSSDMQYLAKNIFDRGIKGITGNIVADESFFDTDYKTLSGHYNGDTGPSYWPYVNALALDKNEGSYNPATSAATLLSNELIAFGLSVQGSVISGSTPKGAKEVTQVSHPIYDVLAHMCKESDNHSAITMFKMLGAKFIDNPGTIEHGQEVISSFLSEIGADRYSYEILEGSGLTRFNKVNAEIYMKVLKYMYDDRFLFDYFINSLSIAGKDGTLKKRMIGTEAEGNVFAKTGTLNGVSALSGYVIDKDNEILMFYCVMNGFGGNANSMRDIQDLACIYLAGFSRK